MGENGRAAGGVCGLAEAVAASVVAGASDGWTCPAKDMPASKVVKNSAVIGL